MRNHSVKKSQLFPDFIIGLAVTLVLTFLSHASGNSSEKHLNFNHCLRGLLFFKKSWMNARRCFATNQTSFNPPTWFRLGDEMEGEGVWDVEMRWAVLLAFEFGTRSWLREEKFLDESRGGKGMRGGFPKFVVWGGVRSSCEKLVFGPSLHKRLCYVNYIVLLLKRWWASVGYFWALRLE